MHWTMDISIGNVITLVGVAIALFRMDRIASKFLIEHEILISDYCKRIGIEVKDMPTRMRSLLK